MPDVPGVRLAVGAAGIRYRDRDDLLLVAMDDGTAAAGVLTQSSTAAAPVLWCRRLLQDGRARGLLVNSGNANAFNGVAGEQAVTRIAAAAAEVLACRPSQVFMASTGVIGEPLPDAKVIVTLADLGDGVGQASWEAAAQATTTTDTFPKGASRTATIDGITVTVNGIAKGSGMIAPDMATMLAFVFTDAAIDADALQALLTRGNARSFNCITVDGDTSTSDTLLAFATGAAGHAPVEDADDPRAAEFVAALDAVLLDLAHQVVRDGEGAQKFITVTVTGAEDDRAARAIAFAIANSPLVKTAIAGADANWGRIVMAVGKAGEQASRDRLTIRIGGVPVAAGGGAVAGYDEGPVAAHMQGREIDLAVDVGIGEGQATVWTCDLTHGYIDINASYRS